jgi:hypothetical protein
VKPAQLEGDCVCGFPGEGHSLGDGHVASDRHLR